MSVKKGSRPAVDVPPHRCCDCRKRKLLCANSRPLNPAELREYELQLFSICTKCWRNRESRFKQEYGHRSVAGIRREYRRAVIAHDDIPF